ncbi:MAG: hypothetical protein M5R36_02980 [Deltaproteobacteria bacterium]|nr:hypothetical protein [Deltaproteobacteria bacterium]
MDDGGRLIPIEVKSTATPRPGMASTVRSFRTDIGSRAASGFVIHTGDMRLPLGSEVTALPFSEI